MAQSTHGLAQSEALTLAAQKLSRAKLYLERCTADRAGQHYSILGKERLITAQEAYDAAFKAYTNPFGAVKTVDVRWPFVEGLPF